MNEGGTSVVMAVFNGAAWIEATLRSVEAQTRAPARVVLVDDGSTDASLEIASRFSFVEVRRNPGKGANAARRHGLAAVSSPWVAFLDQDDLWHPEHLARLEAVLEAHADCSAAFGRAVLFYRDGELQFGASSEGSDPVDPWAAFPTVSVQTPSQVLIRRETLLARGGWETRFVGLADHHAWLRLSADRPLRALRSSTLGYRQHVKSYSSTLRLDNQFGYIERYLDASADVLPLRQACCPDRWQDAEARLRLVRRMASWLRAIHLPAERRNARAAASALERELALHPPALPDELWRQLFYFLYRAPGRSSTWERGRVVASHWLQAPFGCRNVRRSLFRLLTARWRHA